MPSEAWLELTERNPAGWVWEVMETLAYADAKAYVDRTPPDERDYTPLVELVIEMEQERADRWVMERRKQREATG